MQQMHFSQGVNEVQYKQQNYVRQRKNITSVYVLYQLITTTTTLEK